MASNNATRQMKQLSQNLKKTQLGVSFAKKLFTDPHSLSAKQITTVLKSLGVNVPPEVQAGAEVAQIITSGQAISEAIEAKKSIDDMKSLTQPTAVSVRALNAIASHNGWIDEDTTSVVSYGTNVAMIFASGGANVAAWIGLAMDIAATIASKQGEADINALKDMQSKYVSLISSQGKVLGDTFKEFQSGDISIYGLISKMAVETPDLWPQVINPQSPFVNMFPDLMMLPTISKTITGRGDSKIWGDWPWPASGSYVLASWTSSKSMEYLSINKMTKEEAAEYFYTILLKPWLTAYAVANDEIVNRGNMAMLDVAALSYLVNPSGEISATSDYVNMLIGANLTPYDFNNSIIEDIAAQYLEDMYRNTPHAFVEQGINVGLTSSNRGFNAYQRDADIMRAKLLQVRQTDSIYELAQIPYIYQKLQSYMDFETVSFEKDPTLGGKINEKFSSQSVTAWRKLHNYIAVINMLSTFKSDSYLRNTRYAQNLLPFMPSVNEFEEKVQRLNFLSVTRSVNNLALKNIASFLGVKPSQLKQLKAPTETGAAHFQIKGS